MERVGYGYICVDERLRLLGYWAGVAAREREGSEDGDVFTPSILVKNIYFAE